jgi:hypothetical protein
LAAWLSVCALSLLLIALTIAFHLLTRYDWYFGGSFQPWRMQTVEALRVLGAPLLGALIVWRQPTNRYGWVWCLLGLAAAVSGAAFAYEFWAWYVAPVQPGGFEAAWLGTVTDTLYFGLFPLALLLFPDGRPPSPRWRPMVWVTVVVAVVWTLATAVAPGPMIEGTPNIIVSLHGTPAELARWLVIELERAVRLLIAVGGLSLLARLRHARGRQRQQVKWLTYVGVLIAAALVVQLKWHPIGLVLLGPEEGWLISSLEWVAVGVCGGGCCDQVITVMRCGLSAKIPSPPRCSTAQPPQLVRRSPKLRLRWLLRASIPTRQLRSRRNRRVRSWASRALPGVPVGCNPTRLTPSAATARSLAAVRSRGHQPPSRAAGR